MIVHVILGEGIFALLTYSILLLLAYINVATIIPDLAVVALFIYIYLSIYSLDTSSPTAHVHNGKTKRFAPSSPKAPVKKKTRKRKIFPLITGTGTFVYIHVIFYLMKFLILNTNTFGNFPLF